MSAVPNDPFAAVHKIVSKRRQSARSNAMTWTQKIISGVSPTMPYLLVGLFVAIVVVLAAAFFVLHSAKRPDEEEMTDGAGESPQAPDAPSAAATPAPSRPPRIPLSAGKLKRSFRRAMRLLRAHMPGPKVRYDIPWILMIGQTGSGKTRALAESGMNLTFDRPVQEGPEVKAPLNWWFFEKGIVLDVAGDMVLDAGGEGNNRRLWRLLMRELQKHRLERPLDGVVLTVSSKDLLDSDPNRLADKAERLRHRLAELQNGLGLSLPVYVVVTQANRIEGFEDLCRVLPDTMAGNMVGWSSPYGVDTAYSEEWCDQLDPSLERSISLLQYELFTEGIDPIHTDGVFLFSEALRGRMQRVRLLLDRLFKPGAYHESSIFRGVYFCGEGFPEPSSDRRRTFFLRDVFEKKVFPEFRLSRPLRKNLLSRNRTVLALQVAAAAFFLIGSIGLWQAYHRIRNQVSDTMPVLNRIVSDVGNLRSRYDINNSQVLYQLLTRQSPFADSAEHLLRNLGRIRPFRSVFFPSSWFDRLNDNNTALMTDAFGEIILKGFYFQLHQEAKKVFIDAEKSIPPAPLPDSVQNLSETPEFKRLQNFVDNLKQLEYYIELYNNLPQAESLKPLNELSKFLFGIDTGFQADTEYSEYQATLAALHGSRLKRFDPKIFRLKTQYFTLNKLVDQLYRRLFDNNEVRAHLDALGIQIDRFGSKQRSGDRDSQQIRALLEAYDETEHVLTAERNAFLFHPTFDIGAPFGQLLDSLQQLDFVGKDQIDSIRQDGEKRFQDLREALKSEKTQLTGYMLARRGGDIQPELSARTLGLKKDLNRLLENDFMVLEPMAPKEVSIDLTSGIHWDAGVLQEAVQLFQPYQSFLTQDLGQFEPGLQDTVSRMARNGIENRLLDLLTQAAQPMAPSETGYGMQQKENALLAEIRNFKAAIPQLVILFNDTDKLDLLRSQQALTSILGDQVGRLLEGCDGLLKNDHLYTPSAGAIANWNGEPGLGYAAFQAADASELKNYLALQRARVAYLADQFATPLIAFLGQVRLPAQHVDDERIRYRWRHILDELGKYQGKKPDNTLGKLETFVLFEMNEVTPANFRKKMKPEVLTDRSSDYFLMQRNRLRKEVYERCRQLAYANVVERYQLMEKVFNTKLAGRFPFSAIDAPTDHAATPEDIRDFFTAYDANAADVTATLGTLAASETEVDPALAFLHQMAAVRGVFVDFLDAGNKPAAFPAFTAVVDAQGNPKPPVPGFDLDIAFRVNRAMEVGGNQIIDWALSIGDQTFRFGDTTHTGQWQYGQPVLLSLRWAKDAPEHPTFAGEGKGVQISGRTVSYRFDGPWALLRMLARYRASADDLADAAAQTPHVLEFSIDTRTGDEKFKDALTAHDRVFIRITLMTSGKKKQVLVMPYFPERAPVLDAAETPVAP